MTTPVGTAGAGGRATSVGGSGTAMGAKAFDEVLGDGGVAAKSRTIGTAKGSCLTQARNPGTASGSCKVDAISIALVDGRDGGGIDDVAGHG